MPGRGATFWQSLIAQTSRRGSRLLALLATLLLLLASSLWPGQHVDTPSMVCVRHRTPRVVSHRGVDEDASGAVPTTIHTVTALLESGVTSFDLDLFWAASAEGELYIGHPPSLRKLWQLNEDVHALPLTTLSQKAQPHGLLRLRDLLRTLAGRRRSLGLVSFELKFPDHPDWRQHLRLLYAQVAAARISTQVAGVVLDAAQAVAHREAQHAAGVRVPLLLVLRDSDAPVGLDGEPHANMSVLAAASGFEGWSASWKILDSTLRRAAPKGALASWTVDTEPALRRAWSLEVDDVVTNRAAWARSQLSRWVAEEEAQCHRTG